MLANAVLYVLDKWSELRRLRRLASNCADFGERVQESVFEFRLDKEPFDQLWHRVCAVMNPNEEILIAHALDSKSPQRRRRHGQRALLTQRRTSYVL
jgi:CRISPR-associated endonuclease Cas2